MAAEKIEVIAELKDLISGKFKEINAQIDAMDSKLAGMNGGGGGKGGIMGSVLGANLLTGAITAAGSAIVQFGKDSFDAYGRAEQFQVSLKTLLYGNADQANALNNQLKQFALQTPFELTEIQEGTKMMIAYGSSAGNVVNEMRMLGDIGSGVGSSLSELAYLYGTLRTQGRAFSKDIYQFTGRGIPIVKELAKQFKVSESAVMGLVEKGAVGFKEVEKAMKSMTEQGGQFHDMMKAQSQTLFGQTSNLADAWEQLKASIGESQQGILKGTVSWTTDMVNAMGRMVNLSNFQDKATAGLDKSMKFKTGAFNLFKDNFTGDDKDDRYTVKLKSGELREFLKEKDQKDYYEKNKSNVFSMYTAGTTDRFSEFSESILKKISTATTENSPALLKELDRMSRQIIGESNVGLMSKQLAVNELAVLSQAIKDVRGVKGLGDDAKKGSAAAAEPKKLDEVAKANRAVQMIVNIENLIREYTNEMITPDQAKQMTTTDVSKALVAAVNDLYAVGM